MRYTTPMIRNAMKGYNVQFASRVIPVAKPHQLPGDNSSLTRKIEDHHRIISDDGLFTITSTGQTCAFWKAEINPLNNEDHANRTKMNYPVELIGGMGLDLPSCLAHFCGKAYDYPSWVWRPTDEQNEALDDDYQNYQSAFSKVDNKDGTFRIECRFFVYRNKFGHHPSWLPQDEERGRREGFSTKFWFLVQDNIDPVFADMALLYYRYKYDGLVTKIENDDKLWDKFPFKSCDILYSK